MAFRENLLQHIDLASLLGKQAMKQGDSERQQDEDQQRRLEEMKAQMDLQENARQKAAYNNSMQKFITPNNVSGIGGTEKFLKDTPGYMTGVSPEEVFKQKMETGRAMLGAMASGGGGYGRGGRGDGEQTQEPPSQYQGGYKITTPSELIAQQQSSDRRYEADRGVDAARYKSEGDAFDNGYKELISDAKGDSAKFKDQMKLNDSVIDTTKSTGKDTQQQLANSEVKNVENMIYKSPLFKGLSAAARRQAISDVKILMGDAKANNGEITNDIINGYLNKFTGML